MAAPAPANGQRVRFPDAYGARVFVTVDREAGIYQPVALLGDGGAYAPQQVNTDATAWVAVDPPAEPESEPAPAVMAEGQYLVGLPVGVHIAEDGTVTLTVYAEDLVSAIAEDDATEEHRDAASRFLNAGTALTVGAPVPFDAVAAAHQPESLRDFPAGGQWRCSCGSSGTTKDRRPVDGHADHVARVRRELADEPPLDHIERATASNLALAEELRAEARGGGVTSVQWTAREVMRTLPCDDCGVGADMYCRGPRGVDTTEHAARYQAAVDAGLLPLKDPS